MSTYDLWDDLVATDSLSLFDQETAGRHLVHVFVLQGVSSQSA